MQKTKKFHFFPLMFLAVFLSACASGGSTAPAISLDRAIKEAAENIENNLDKGVVVALLNFSSTSQSFSEHVLEELSGALVNSGKLTVVDRDKLELIRQEEQFQLSGEVSDESAINIGRKLGAQMIVTGSLRTTGSGYRFRVTTLSVETAAVKTYSSSVIHEKDKDTVFLLASSKPAVQSVPVQQPQTAAPVKKNYKIGDTGPAGGTVFYDRGVYESGWRYLEAAPDNIGPAQWGAYNFLIAGTIEDIGGGKQNTERILAALKLRAEIGRAAQLAANYEHGGFSDWFLPSKDELNLMFINLKQENRGGFPDDNTHYWSSTDGDEYSAWIQNFRNGRQGGMGKHITHSVRPIRAF